MTETIKLKIEQGKYEEIEELCKEMEITKLRDMMLNIAYETESMSVYGFIVYMLQKNKNLEWLKLAIDVLLNPLCFIEGAYSIALFHARKILDHETNVENLERILFFYNIPEKLIDDEEAYCISEKILAREPDNKVALQIKHGF